MAIPITIITGFLGSGKTTLILNLIPQLPKDYKLALLKNEFGDLALDSQLASSAAISGVQEILGGCICCNLVGQLGDALETLRKDINPNRIIIETSGSALPATLVFEVNRLIKTTGLYSLDGVINVIDVQNFDGYEDTSYTAKIQAKYTDLIILNKWELVDEQRYDRCLDLIDHDTNTPVVKSNKGTVPREVMFGIDGSLARDFETNTTEQDYEHGSNGHSSEVEVLSCTLTSDSNAKAFIDTTRLVTFLKSAVPDEIYRIKAIIWAEDALPSSDEPSNTTASALSRAPYLLNWAFGRWTSTPSSTIQQDNNAILRMTIITGRYESTKWKKRLETGDFLKLKGSDTGSLSIEKIL